MEKLLNLIFIPECLFCRDPGSFFCERCLSSCKLLTPINFHRHKLSRAKFLFVYEYERFIRECIRKAKFKNKHFAALKVLAQKCAEILFLLITINVQSENKIIVPIPVSKAKLYKRGFNQAELIAQIFSKKLKMPMYSNHLVRAKETTSQYANNRVQRFQNLKDAFELRNTSDIKNPAKTCVILIDDICTTGATFLEASRTLFEAGIAEVICVSLARKSLEKSA